MADAGGIDEAESDVAKLDAVLDGVARGSLNVADDGAIFAKEGVEQGALAYVWCSDDGYGDAVFQGVTNLEGLCEASDVGIDGLRELQEFRAVGKFEVFVVAEVEFEFEQRGDFQQLFAQSA